LINQKKEEKESKESRNIKQAFIAKYIRAGTVAAGNKNIVTGFSCCICDEYILDLDKYKPDTKDEYVDILFNHLILKHDYEIHYNNNKEEKK